jgi:histidyl-tRNA synthetase
LVEVLPAAFRDRLRARRGVVVLPLGDAAMAPGLRLARGLATRGIAVHTEVTGRSLKAGLKWASKIGAAAALILGDRELASGEVVLRDLDRGEQESVPVADVADRLTRLQTLRYPSSGRDEGD